MPPERRGVTIKAPSSFPARDFAELIAGILPAGLEVTLDPSGVRVIGEEAGRWEDPLSMVRTLLDTDNSRGPAVLLVTQFKTPDGFCGLYLLQAEAYAATHTQALLAVPGVRRVGRSAGLRALLVLGEGKAQTEAGALMQRMAAPS